MTQTAKLVLVQLTILLVGLVCIELILRYVVPLPVHGGTYHTRDGATVRVALDKLRLKPNLEVTHKASEFSVQIRTNERGYRKLAKESATPYYVFLGDSFTFGHGVSDAETFSQLFCTARDVTCLNLGRPGTNTFQQLRVLEYALDAHQVRPKVVVLVMLTACWIHQSGNDLGDNLKHYRTRYRTGLFDNADARRALTQGKIGGGGPRKSKRPNRNLTKRVQQWIGNFEITKRVMFIFSSVLKRNLYGCSDQDTIDSAIESTRVALDELEHLATEFGFDVKVFSIHPYQELDGAFRKTQSDLSGAIPPAFEYTGTGDTFRRAHYFPYDGHFNRAGHANMAAIIESNLTGKTSEDSSR